MSTYAAPQYVSIPVAYDVETTNYRVGEAKASIVYSHAFSVDGDVHILRTWAQMHAFTETLIKKYDVHSQNRLVVYVHNLSHEWGFIKHYFQWIEAMAIGSEHRIAKAVTAQGIEFRCSYLLTNSALAHVGDDVGIPKLKGDLDYDLLRHSGTPLTEAELGYITNDVQIIVELIRQRMARDGSLKNIPITKTGYVRRSVRTAVRKDKGYSKYIKSLPLSTEVYTIARQAFQGGYTHANSLFTNQVVNDVTGVDLSSSYPASMVKGLYPVTTFEVVEDPSVEFIDQHTSTLCMLIDMTLFNVTSKYPFPPISDSKALRSSGTLVDNGRIYNADEVRVVVTNVDYEIIMRAYDVEAVSVNNIQAAKAGHLPTALVDSVLGFYGDKTILKGVEGREEDYDLAKENTNSIYGMVATDPVRVDYEFNPETASMDVLPIDLETALDKHNRSRSRFLYYPWACWITAYSRSTLLGAIYDLIDCEVDVLYCDTDSIYFRSNPVADKVIDVHNDAIIKDLLGYFRQGQTTAEALEILSPKTIHGVRKPLGVFEVEGHYDQFKSLGAKRYAVVKEIDGAPRTVLTVAGLSKRVGDYKEDGEWKSGFVSRNGGMPFFKADMHVPAGDSGRLVHTYSDEINRGTMTDYTDLTADVEQMGFVHLEAADYTLSISEDYLTFIGFALTSKR